MMLEVTGERDFSYVFAVQIRIPVSSQSLSQISLRQFFHHDDPSLGGRSSKSTIVDNKLLRVYHNDVSLYNIRQRHTLQLL